MLGAALQACARRRDDRDLEVWTAEIKLRASVRIGELVRELDKARPGPTTADMSRQRDTSPKREAIRDVSGMPEPPEE